MIVGTRRTWTRTRRRTRKRSKEDEVLCHINIFELLVSLRARDGVLKLPLFLFPPLLHLPFLSSLEKKKVRTGRRVKGRIRVGAPLGCVKEKWEIL